MLLRGRLRLVALGALLLSACGPRAPLVDSDGDTAPVPDLYEGRALVQSARADLALRHYEAMISAHPDSWQAHRGLQDVLRSTLAPAAFHQRYVEPVTDASGDALAWYLRGRAEITDPAAALRGFTRAAELDPKAPWPRIGLAYLHWARGDLFSAVELYEAELKALPHSKALRLAAANQYIELRLLVQAQRHLEIALALAPEDPEVQAAMGKVQLGLGNADGALAFLERAVKTEPRLSDAWAQLGTLYLQLSRAEEADRAYREALRLGQPEDPELATAIRVALLMLTPKE